MKIPSTGQLARSKSCYLLDGGSFPSQNPSNVCTYTPVWVPPFPPVSTPSTEAEPRFGWHDSALECQTIGLSRGYEGTFRWRDIPRVGSVTPTSSGTTGITPGGQRFSMDAGQVGRLKTHDSPC